LLARTSLLQIGRLFQPALCVLCLAFIPQLPADVGLLLSEPTGEGTSRWTSAGHAAIYFSRICPVSPVELRLCGPGEDGSVLSNYEKLGEDRRYEWNLVPLNVFLYGVEDTRNRPLFASQKLREKLEERFWQRDLYRVCSGTCSDNPRAQWRNMVAAPFVRGIYLFAVKTTLEQDLNLMARFNALPNVGHHNGFIHNCADFARSVINAYFPGAAQPDRVNDFGMTSPKAIAKSFSRYAERRPELELHVVRFGQVPGDFKETGDCRKGTEVAFRSKKWLFPMMLRSHELALFAASYWLTGRFDPEHELQLRPTEKLAANDQEMAAAVSDGHRALVRQLEQKDQHERTVNFGTREEWRSYAAAVDTMTSWAMEKGLISDRAALRRLFREADARGSIFVDDNGAAWLDLPDGVLVRHAGISASNIAAPESDPQLAFLIMLARVDRILHCPSKNRELMPQFKADLALLEQTRDRLEGTEAPAVVVASAPGPVGTTRRGESSPQESQH
jgi:hypothetical protein